MCVSVCVCVFLGHSQTVSPCYDNFYVKELTTPILNPIPNRKLIPLASFYV